jgi:hypothetical protein
MRNDLRFLMLAFTLALTANSAAQEHKKATPPTNHDMVGAWVGFDRGGGAFMRLGQGFGFLFKH